MGDIVKKLTKNNRFIYKILHFAAMTVVVVIVAVVDMAAVMAVTVVVVVVVVVWPMFMAMAMLMAKFWLMPKVKPDRCLLVWLNPKILWLPA
ncbi:hypothetical protein RO3G_01321 [Rhizopus delemar RA 99-880]|uniref:Uncharacterized protein n=1 Tax=Rhizopus delemar (strain RA 99-880 / ATCC MYA-4621 / FGSC 9543 / NRRL 43880) TaxID=246409 RepID=I1BK87_RHIO9|nr:hypothetical protein RO3G_01321 [Rhizopus delemar RA 99-880]|eukprot:EIE76617.1 hypothetical protein RO3G_01321 [Rhizopus delemar RA 99-880]